MITAISFLMWYVVMQHITLWIYKRELRIQKEKREELAGIQAEIDFYELVLEVK